MKRAGLNHVRWYTDKHEKVKVLMVLYDGGKDAQEFPELLGKLPLGVQVQTELTRNRHH